MVPLLIEQIGGPGVSQATHEVRCGNRVEVGSGPLVSASHVRVLSAQDLK